MGENCDPAEARAMLDLYASVGATRCDVTWTYGHAIKERFRRGVPIPVLSRAMPAILDHATGGKRNVIVRPTGRDRTFIQLDDLTADKLPRIAPPVFLILETSSGSFQAWLALAGTVEQDLGARLKQPIGADVNASGATRIAGSLNFKEEHGPDFPRVAIRQANAGRLTTVDELQRLGLVGPKQILPPLPRLPVKPRHDVKRTWPSFARTLEGAPLNRAGEGPDRSKADIVWLMTAIDWGFDPTEAAYRLMEEPESKAFHRGEKYALSTARKAAFYIEQRKLQGKARRYH
jgi:hypothetical protein